MPHHQVGTDRVRLVKELRLMLGRVPWLGLRVLTSAALPARTDADPSAEPEHASYVYCVIDSPHLDAGSAGMGLNGRDVSTVHYRHIAAVVSHAPLTVMAPTKNSVLVHHRVNGAVMQRHALIPMPFGTLLKTDDHVIELLRSGYPAFTAVLDNVRHKVEYCLRGSVKRSQFIRSLEAADGEIARLRDVIQSNQRATFEVRREYGRLVDDAFQAFSTAAVAGITERLRDVTLAARLNEPIDDWMVINGAFLVFRDAAPAFEARIAALEMDYGRLMLQSSGPWPPYNFAHFGPALDDDQEPFGRGHDGGVPSAWRAQFQSDAACDGDRVDSEDRGCGSKSIRYVFAPDSHGRTRRGPAG